MPNKNKNLSKAKTNKNDEFYTQLTDIEKELVHYKDHFKGKTVLCNCDDPFESNFFKYFVLNFNHLGLKKLICTCYAGSPVAGTKLQYHMDANGQMSFIYNANGQLTGSKKHAYKAVINVLHDATGDGGIMMDDVAELFKTGENQLTELDGDGDFRSPECIELLKEADIVCTNPPFSLFREYVAQLMGYKKDFLIIGNPNAITYKEFFPLLKDNKVWIGYKSSGQDMLFNVSPDYETELRKTKKEGSGYRIVDDHFFARAAAIWYTNLDIKKHHEYMICFKNYDPTIYFKYENYDAINVDKLCDIPCDYNGVMGVPITILDEYCEDQFKILECHEPCISVEHQKKYNPKFHEYKSRQLIYNGILCQKTYHRIFIRYTDSWIASHPNDFKDTRGERS